MGKIILEFDSIEEQDDARDALDGYKWKLAMWDIDQHLRSELKYNDNIEANVYDTLEKLRDEIRDILEGYGIQLDH
jgi:hypothetical protein